MWRNTKSAILVIALAFPIVSLAQETRTALEPVRAPAVEAERWLGVQTLKPEVVAVDPSELPGPLVVPGVPVAIGGFHVFPAWEPGPYQGPPTSIWSAGWWGITPWRDPITGWPLQ